MTYREHYIAHLLLAKISGDRHPKLWLALTRMNKPEVYNSRLYSVARRKCSELRAFKNRTEFDYSKVLPILHRNNSVLQNRPWKNFNAREDNLVFWRRADIVYDSYVSKEYPEGGMHSYLSKKIDLPRSKLKILRNILKMIDKGWIPAQDEEWLRLAGRT